MWAPTSSGAMTCGWVGRWVGGWVDVRLSPSFIHVGKWSFIRA